MEALTMKVPTKAHIKDILTLDSVDKEFIVYGWVKTTRQQSDITFIALNDGSCLSNLQIIVGKDVPLASGCTVGASLRATGKMVKSPAKGQLVELLASEIHLYGPITSAKDYPLAKKGHPLEYLRSICHLRPRTNTMAAVMRIRHSCSMATHDFFDGRGYKYIHTPIITCSDCEGAGETFNVTTDYKDKFFDRDVYLTVSGQLNVEAFCCSMGNVYTFGPTFRAEKSHTSRHLAEFWMIEPELAFADLSDVMECAEFYVKFCIKYLLMHNKEDLEFLDNMYSKGLVTRLENIIHNMFIKMSYTDAVALLQTQDKFKTVQWGDDLSSEQEKWLARDLPVIVHDYPREIKSFYMKDNIDRKTVGAMDILIPGIGELIGGSTREEDYDTLLAKMIEFKMDISRYDWYLDLRKWGSIPHGGFGLGFERLLLLVTGMENIRDVIPYPRAPGTISY